MIHAAAVPTGETPRRATDDGAPEPRRARLFHHAEEQARELGIPMRHVDQLAWALALQGGL